MENIPIKLNSPVNEFHFFEDNQVLTADQLNRVIRYLDNQHRLTRTKLLGTGIVCGLEISTDNRSSISLSKGAAITTDGDIIHLNTAARYTQFKVFDDQKAMYTLFGKTEASEAFDLYRLYSDSTTDSEVDHLSPLTDFNEGNRSLDNMVLVLYLNSFLEPPEDCTELDCDNAGPKQRAELVPLLIAQSDLDRLNHKDQDAYFQLPEVNIERVVLANDNNTNTDNIPSDAITQRQHLYQRFKTAINNSQDSLIEALVQSCGTAEGDFFRDLIRPLYKNASPADKWKASIQTQLDVATNNTRIPYVYDYIKDLAAAYNEFKSTVYELYVECCPSPANFPKHIMVGTLTGPSETYLPDNYRHHFCESPILNKNDQRVQKAMFLHKRIDLMILAFNPPTFTSASAIDITPAFSDDRPLSERPIPFYYHTVLVPLPRYWSFEKNKRGQQNTILGYFNRNNQSALAAAKSPFRYCSKGYNRYRIEGHLGQNLEAVEKRIEDLKRQYNISFKVENIMISSDSRRIKLPPRFKFPALDNLLFHYREDLFDSINLVKDFNTELAGANINDDDFANDQDTKSNISRAKSKASLMNNELEKVNTTLYQKMDVLEAQFTTFETAYVSAISLGHEIKEKVYNSTQTKHILPHQDFVNKNKINRFKQLFDYRKKKKERLREQFLFQKFYEKNIGLEHLAGVPVGGTFVLVYEEVNNQNIVVADFALPYCCSFEEEPEVEVVPPTPGTIKPPTKFIPPALDFKWIDKLDIFRVPKLNNRFTQITTFADDFKLQSENFYGKVIPNILTAKIGSTGTGVTIPDENIVVDNGLIDSRFNNLWDSRIGEVEGRFNNRINDVDLKIDNQGRGFDARFDDQQSELNRINLIETQVNNNAQAVGRIPNIESRINSHQTQVNRIGGIETRLNNHQAQINKIPTLEASVQNINTEISDVDWSVLRRTDGGGGGFVFRPNVDTPIVFPLGPGITPSSRALVGNISESNLQSLAANVVSIALVVQDLQNLKRPKKAEKEQLVANEKLLDTAIENLLTKLKGLKKDIKPTSNEANALNAIIENLGNLKTKPKLPISKKLLIALKKSHQKRSILTGLLKQIKI